MPRGLFVGVLEYRGSVITIFPPSISLPLYKNSTMVENFNGLGLFFEYTRKKSVYIGAKGNGIDFRLQKVKESCRMGSVHLGVVELK